MKIIAATRRPDLRVVLVKPSKYSENGFVERFWKGFMPNSTLSYICSMTRDYAQRTGAQIEIHGIDEYVENDLEYLNLLQADEIPTLVALVGVQSHQFHRALDLSALAAEQGCHAIIGGPHPMTCQTTELQNRGVSFAVSEAELTWGQILEDAQAGQLQSVYGENQRWQRELDAPILEPPSPEDMKNYVVKMLGVYPARGCPFRCNFCSVIKIAGRQIRSQTTEVTLETLRLARKAGVDYVMFTSDNFNKIPQVRELLQGMIEENLNIGFFVQCDTQIGGRDRDLIPLLAQAGCFQMFVGVESFSRQVLREAQKFQNHPDRYSNISELCRSHGIESHFSNIIGFPGDTEESILNHLRVLIELNPVLASFYILTPIPGTEQYDDFLARDLIVSRNLDRFDGTCPVWKHDILSSEELKRLLFLCYKRFFSVQRAHQHHQLSSLLNVENLGRLLFMKLQAYRQTHPMSGGVWRIQRDHVNKYIDRRKSFFGFEMAPLPLSLSLPAADAELNRHVKLA